MHPGKYKNHNHNDNPNDIWNAIGLISYMLIFTGIFLLVMKFSKTGKILY